MRLKLYIVVAVFGLSLYACDKVENPYVPVGDICDICDSLTTFTDPVQTKRNVLLEEFTGHTCVNCPGGALEAQNIHANGTYGDQVILVAIHGDNSFTKAQNNPDGSYSTDWTTEEGIDYEAFFSTDGLPNAMISRVGFPVSSHVKYKTDWSTEVQNLVGLAPDVSLKSAIQYDETGRTVCVNTEVEFLNNLSGNFKLVHYLVEDSIVDWQLNSIFVGNPAYADGDIPDYLHRHVLRDVFGHEGEKEGIFDGSGNIWGTTVGSGTVTSGETFYVLNSLCEIDPSWDADHLAVITYIMDNDTKEILQVLEHEVIEP